MQYEKASDTELIEKFKTGDKLAFDILMERHFRAVMNLIYRFTGCTGREAEDMAQEVFLRIFRALPRFEARAKFFTYLYKVTMNLCLKERTAISRDKNKLVSIDENWEDSDAPRLNIADPKGTPQDELERQELCERVRQAVLDLPEEQRAAVILYRYKELSYEETAEALGITLPAVKSRLHRAKLALKKALAEYK